MIVLRRRSSPRCRGELRDALPRACGSLCGRTARTCQGRRGHVCRSRAVAGRRDRVRAFARRFTPRLADPAFRAASTAHRRFPEWDRTLHPREVRPRRERIDANRTALKRTTPFEQAIDMKLIWKFNLVLLGIFLLGLRRRGLRLVPRAAGERARGDPAERAAHDGGGAVLAHLHDHAGQAAARDAAQVHVPAADGARVRRHRACSTTCARSTRTTATRRRRSTRPIRATARATGKPTSSTPSARRPTTTELVGERDTPTGRALYLARPIQITNAACLVCHSTVEAAPKTMIDLYGPANGFGWKMNEVIGAQVVSVPMSVPIARANADVPHVHAVARRRLRRDVRAAERDAAHRW